MTAMDLRKKDLARIHIYKAKLGLDDDAYRDFLKGITGQDSSKGLDQKQRWSVIREMGRLAGERPKTAPRGHFVGKPPTQTPASGKQPLLGKIGALLADRKLPWQYAHSMAFKMFRIACVQWLTPDQLWRMVAALEIQKRRITKRADQAANENAKGG